MYGQCVQSTSRFRAQQGHSREPASCAGERENLLALQARIVWNVCYSIVHRC
jgi:hypothetical protein